MAEIPNCRFAIRYSRANRVLLGVLGLGPRSSGVELTPAGLHVRMGWAWDVDIPRASIAEAGIGARRRFTAGVHGWRGSWLVNGAGTGIVCLRVDPPVRTRSLFLPIRLTQLEIAVEDPEGLLAALRG